MPRAAAPVAPCVGTRVLRKAVLFSLPLLGLWRSHQQQFLWRSQPPGNRFLIPSLGARGALRRMPCQSSQQKDENKKIILDHKLKIENETQNKRQAIIQHNLERK